MAFDASELFDVLMTARAESFPSWEIKLLKPLVLLVTVALAYLCAGYIRDFRARHTLDAFPVQTQAATPISTNLSGCMALASATYQVPINVLQGITHVEGGRIGQAVRNTNGTYDLGPMQINSLWVPQLAKMWHVSDAEAWAAIRDSPCENVYIGTWILKQKIAETGTLYNGIAYYHSATKGLGHAYANKVIGAMSRPIPPPPYLH